MQGWRDPRYGLGEHVVGMTFFKKKNSLSGKSLTSRGIEGELNARCWFRCLVSNSKATP